jgi:murein DD-endopeptidase MepM/ murein hydrolase activator NlpD
MLKKTTLKEEVGEFIVFISQYLKTKVIVWAKHFENAKSILVTILISKRGKYQKSFLNTSFFLLVATIYMAGPIIAENNPLIGNNLENSPDTGSAVISMYTLGAENTATTKISQKPRDGIVNYTVESGDTLSTIANKFDISIETIRWANDLGNDTITAGDTIKIPPISGTVHKVQSGDNVYTIAEKYSTDAQKIVNFPFNEFSDLDTFALVPGQTLYVPDGVPPSSAPAKRIQPNYPQYVAGQSGGGSGTFIWPTTGGISQYPVWYHMALDIANSSSPPVIAADSGTVTYSGCLNWGYGCHVIVNHNNGYQTLYAHLSSLGVSAGQGVGKGQSVGTMGSTGRSTGTHLHFEIRQNGVLLNPLDFLQ